MNSTQTATTDGFGRSVQITNGRFVATMMTGLLPVADMVSRIQLLAPLSRRWSRHTSRKTAVCIPPEPCFGSVFSHISADLRI